LVEPKLIQEELTGQGRAEAEGVKLSEEVAADAICVDQRGYATLKFEGVIPAGADVEVREVLGGGRQVGDEVAVVVIGPVRGTSDGSAGRGRDGAGARELWPFGLGEGLEEVPPGCSHRGRVIDPLNEEVLY